MFEININTEYGAYYLKDSLNLEENNSINLSYLDEPENTLVECVNIFGLPFFEGVNKVILLFDNTDLTDDYEFHQTVILRSESLFIELSDWSGNIYAKIPVSNKDVKLDFYSEDSETLNPLIILIGD